MFFVEILYPYPVCDPGSRNYGSLLSSLSVINLFIWVIHAFNTVQVISRGVVLLAEETST